jgi:hypothetical protein
MSKNVLNVYCQRTLLIVAKKLVKLQFFLGPQVAYPEKLYGRKIKRIQDIEKSRLGTFNPN